MSAAPIRVLVIDDGDGLAKNVARMLRPEHDVTIEISPTKALAQLAGGASFDAIVCGLTMPELGGEELHAQLRSTRPDLVERVAFVTSGTLSPVTRRFIGTVAERVIVKPFGLSELRDVVNRAATGKLAAAR